MSFAAGGAPPLHSARTGRCMQLAALRRTPKPQQTHPLRLLCLQATTLRPCLRPCRCPSWLPARTARAAPSLRVGLDWVACKGARRHGHGCWSGACPVVARTAALPGVGAWALLCSRHGMQASSHHQAHPALWQPQVPRLTQLTPGPAVLHSLPSGTDPEPVHVEVTVPDVDDGISQTRRSLLQSELSWCLGRAGLSCSCCRWRPCA